MSNYVVVDTSGAVVRAGDAPDAMIALQAGEGERAFAIPLGVLAWPEINIPPLRTFLKTRIDREANEVCYQFVTPGDNQMLRYMAKEREARAWLQDNSVETFFLSAEAERTGLSVAQLAPIVMERAKFWAIIGGEIEGARRAANDTVDQETNVGAIFSAAGVDWDAAIAVGMAKWAAASE